MAHHPQPPGIKGRSDESAPLGARATRLLEAASDRSHAEGRRAASTVSPHVAWARSGAMWLTGSADAAPRFARGSLACAAHDAGCAIATLSGSPAHATRDWPMLLGERASLFGLHRGGRRSCGGKAELMPTRDGWIVVQLPREDDWRAVPAWLEIDAERLPDVTSDTTSADDARWAVVHAVVRTRATEALLAQGRLLGLAVAPAPRDVPDDAPLFRLRAPTESRPESPTTSMRVLDLSTLWAGPLAGSILAEAGADVVKVESPDRPDGARAAEPRFFDLMNAGKDGAALDLKTPADRARFEALLAAADVVLESARPRALAQLGYDGAAWAAERPGRLWVSVTGYGRAHEWIAFGDDAAIAAGLAWPGASRDPDEPAFCGDAIADPLTGLHAAALALAHRGAGRGGLLELALRDVAADCARDEGTAARAPEVIRASERDDAWLIRLDDRTEPVARPRARPNTGEAPALAPMSDATFERWTGRRC